MSEAKTAVERLRSKRDADPISTIESSIASDRCRAAAAGSVGSPARIAATSASKPLAAKIF